MNHEVSYCSYVVSQGVRILPPMVHDNARTRKVENKKILML